MAMEMFIRKQAVNYAAGTIRKGGAIHLNAKAIEEFHLEGKLFFTLHFDAKAGQIGIKPVDDDKHPSAFKARKEKGKSFTIGCQDFLKAAKVPYSQGSKVLKAEWDPQNGMIVLKIR
jgi:hypothetical protein